MIPATNIRETKSNGVIAKGTFAISLANTSHIMGILRDTLYSDKVLAVLREYSSNAWDAHRSVGKFDLPIKVRLPTVVDPTLTIRDFGPGLSEYDVLEVYTKYGESSKRGSDTTVGMLGIGSKSGFAYSDSFTITSCHDGTKSIYVAYLDPSDKGEINKIAEVPCGDETGLEISLAVRAQDIETFRRKAIDLFRYFEPRPDINITLPEVRRSVTAHGFISTLDAREWTAIMGCVPYRLDLDQIAPELQELGLWNTLHSLHGGLYFNIGEVQISASREELKYSDKTKTMIVTKLQALLDAYVEDTFTALRATEGVTGWDKRIKVRFLSDTLHLPIPKAYSEYNKTRVTLYGEQKPTTFTFHPQHGNMTTIPISPRTQIYYCDTDKPISGYSLEGEPVILCPVAGTTREAVVTEFEACCLEAEIDGLTKFKNFSDFAWFDHTKVRGKGGRSRNKYPTNKKHSVRTFRLKTGVSYCSPWSATWEIESREPKDDDLFVIISEFKAVDWEGFHEIYRKDMALAKRLGVELPPVYGYKTTSEKPITRADCKGNYYRRWRIAFFRGLVTPEHLEIDRLQGWAELLSVNDEPYSYKLRESLGAERTHKSLVVALGAAHPLTVLFQRVLEGRAAYHKVSSSDQSTVTDVFAASRVKLETSEAEKVRETLFNMYPLLGTEGFRSVADEHRDLWIEYIKLVDRDRTGGQRLLLTSGEIVG